MAETEMDITTWPVICLRMAWAEARATDSEQAVRLLAEAAPGCTSWPGRRTTASWGRSWPTRWPA